jgi:methyl-accepting chemotaxis protein
MLKTIQGQLAAAFGALATLLVVIAVFAYHSMANVHHQFTDLVEGDALRAKLSNDVLETVNARAIEARNLVVASSDDLKRRAEQAVNKQHAHVGEALGKLSEVSRDGGASDAERALIDKIVAVEKRYGPVALSIVQRAVSGDREAAIRQMNEECIPLLNELLVASGAHLAYLERESSAAANEESEAFTTAATALTAAGVLATLIAIAMSILIPRGIKNKLGAEPSELNQIVLRVADGNLAPVQGADHAPKDSVLAAVSSMQQDLSAIVSQVRNTSDSIATGSSEIATGNADLSQRTEEQASNLQQTSASMMEIRSTVERNAETARQASQLATSASGSAQQGGEVMRDVVSTMQEIAASAQKVTDIIAVIDGIAFQTNILALNAAVEAARAGEQGRGFAVVAGEVRLLAQRSAEAAKEIKSLIGASTEKVTSGTQLVESAGNSIEDIVAQVRKVADFIAEITSSAIEQTTTIGQVSDAVGQLDQVTQQNAALVEESAAAAESLKHQAAALIQLVGKFRASETM